jgi:hypothetical protein
MKSVIEKNKQTCLSELTVWFMFGFERSIRLRIENFVGSETGDFVSLLCFPILWKLKMKKKKKKNEEEKLEPQKLLRNLEFSNTNYFSENEWFGLVLLL